MKRVNRRDFLKYTGVAGGALFMVMGGVAMSKAASRVALVKTDDRRKGVQESLKTLNINPVKGKDVLIKPNFNTADITPGSTHNDTSGASSPSEIEMIPADEKSRDYRDRVLEILKKG